MELPEERQERIRRMKNAALAKKKILTGRFLQRVLQEETGIEPGKQRYRYNQEGRPSLLRSDLDFNLSDSGDYAVIAVSDQRVGIDIERRKKSHLSIAKRCFCQEEYEDIMQETDPVIQERRFRMYWTMKEAYVKYEGSGLTIPLNSFVVAWQGTEGRSEILPIIKEGNRSDRTQAYGCTQIFQEDYVVSVCQRQIVDRVELRETVLC